MGPAFFWRHRWIGVRAFLGLRRRSCGIVCGAYPFVEQVARLRRCIDDDAHPARQVITEYVLTSRRASTLPPEAMLRADRKYWRIECGLQLRLDVSCGEDKSRVRNRASAFDLAMLRRAAVSVVVNWIQRQRPHLQRNTTDFFVSVKRAASP